MSQIPFVTAAHAHTTNMKTMPLCPPHHEPLDFLIDKGTRLFRGFFALAKFIPLMIFYFYFSNFITCVHTILFIADNYFKQL
jgi:hypothetical protein